MSPYTVRKKTVQDYQHTAEELKALGYSDDEVYDILVATAYGQFGKNPRFKKEALDVSDKENFIFRPVSATVGRVLDYPIRKELGVSGETASLQNKDLAEYLEFMKTRRALKDVGVHLGSSHLMDRFKRTWKNPDVGFLEKTVSTAFSPVTNLSIALNRADHYDPISKTVTLYHADPAILAHELGHAVDFNSAKDKQLANALYMLKTPVNQEYMASNLALNSLAKNLLNKKDVSKEDIDKIKRQAKVLRKAFNTYRRGVGYERGVDAPVLAATPALRSDLDFFLTDPKVYNKIIKLDKKFNPEKKAMYHIPQSSFSPYSHHLPVRAKQSGFFGDHAGKIIGTGLGLGGTAGIGAATNRYYLGLPLAGLLIGSGIDATRSFNKQLEKFKEEHPELDEDQAREIFEREYFA